MNTKRFAEQLAALVGVPSVSCAHPDLDQSNLPVLHFLATWLEDLGFTCQIQPIVGWPGKGNLVAVKGSGPGGLVLAGHSDTVPCNPELWQQDPFTLTDRDNRFYGLGAADMKGFFPVVLAALERFKDVDFAEPLFVLATADEESSMCGARAIAESGSPKARYAIIGEPTGLRPIRMHKGIMLESVRVNGQAGHSSNPALGNNALEVMAQVLNELMVFRSELQSRYRHPGFEVPQPTLNLGCIHGGDSPNRICGQCELHFDLRLLPGMDMDTMRSEIRTRLQPLAERTGTDFVFRSLFPGIAPYEQAADSELVRLAEILSGHTAESVAFATEAPFMKQLGMETLVMGPGSIEQAHQPDEFIAHDQLVPAVSMVAEFIKQLCVRR
jgi:acetylornithine deacetylase